MKAGKTRHSRAAVSNRAIAAAAVVVWGLVSSSTRADEPAKVTYADHIQPIFRQHCFACHGPDKQENDLALNTYASTMTGGASGEPVAAGDPGESTLWLMVTHEISPSMPPGGAKLPDADLARIKAWIEGGLLEKGDSAPRMPTKPAVAEFTPSEGNRPAGEPAMPEGVLREPVIEPPAHAVATAIAASPWAPLAAVGSWYQIALYHAQSGELLGVLPFLEGAPNVMRFSRDGGLLLVGGGRPASLGVAAVYDVKTGRRLTTLGDELDAVLAADITPNHAMVVLGGPRKVVRAYRVADGALAFEITKHTDWITAAEFSPDGKFLATADRSGGLLLWDAATGRERGDLRGHTEAITALSWRGDSALLASASEDDTIRCWQTDGQQVKSWTGHGGGVESVEFNSQGQLASAGRDQTVKLWQADGTAIREVAKLSDMALAARSTHDGARLVVNDWQGLVQIYDAASGQSVAKLDAAPPTLAARLAAAQQRVQMFRTSAEAANAQLVAAQQGVAAAEAALAQARDAAAAAAQAQAQQAAQLASAEQMAAAAANEQATAAEIESRLMADQQQLVADLTAAHAAADAAAKVQTDTHDRSAQQAAAVVDLQSQIEALRGKLTEAEKALETARESQTTADAGAATAAERELELESRAAQLKRRQEEFAAIRALRARRAAVRLDAAR